MKVTIKGHEIELQYTMRSMIIYENITGESFTLESAQSIKSISTLLSAIIMGSAQKQKIDLQLTYDEFMDWLDDNGGSIMINKFGEWLSAELETKYSLMAEEKEDDNFPKQRKKSKH